MKATEFLKELDRLKVLEDMNMAEAFEAYQDEENATSGLAEFRIMYLAFTGTKEEVVEPIVEKVIDVKPVEVKTTSEAEDFLASLSKPKVVEVEEEIEVKSPEPVVKFGDSKSVIVSNEDILDIYGGAQVVKDTIDDLPEETKENIKEIINEAPKKEKVDVINEALENKKLVGDLPTLRPDIKLPETTSREIDKPIEATKDDAEFGHMVEETIPVVSKKEISKIKEIEALVVEDLPVRVVKTYCNGEDLPEVPGLIPTGCLFDELISDRFTTQKQLDEYKERTGVDMPADEIEAGGFTRKCVDIVAGDPGAGKTTNLCTLLARAKIYNRREFGKEIKVSFISAEMRETEWAKELRDSALLRELEVTFMLDYVGFENYEDIFWEAFSDGDIIVCDSFPAIIDHIRMNPKEKRTEKALTADFIRKSLKSVSVHNNNVQLINQATKDGNYKGGTILPHMLSSLSFVRLDGENRYWQYIKNRNNGKVNRKGYFGRTEARDIDFDED